MSHYCGRCRRPSKKDGFCNKTCQLYAFGQKPDPQKCWICGRAKKAPHHKFCCERCKKIGNGYKILPVISNKCFPKLLVDALTEKLAQRMSDPEFYDAMSLGTNASVAAIELGALSNDTYIPPNVLLVLEKRINSFSFGLPGGTREPNEHLLTTAMREWEEETGVPFKNFIDVDITYQFNSNGADIIIMIFVKQLDIRNVVNEKSSIHTEHISFDVIEENKKKNIYYHVQQKVDRYGQPCGGIEPCNCLDKTHCVRFRIRQCMFHGWDKVVDATNQRLFPLKKLKLDTRLL